MHTNTQKDKYNNNVAHCLNQLFTQAETDDSNLKHNREPHKRKEILNNMGKG